MALSHELDIILDFKDCTVLVVEIWRKVGIQGMMDKAHVGDNSLRVVVV